MSALSNFYGLYSIPLGTGTHLPDVSQDKLLPPIKGIAYPQGLPDSDLSLE